MKRLTKALNLGQYSRLNGPEKLSKINLEIPDSRQYILRMLIRDLNEDYKIPEEIKWTMPLIIAAEIAQRKTGIKHPFVYITIRNGLVTSETDDEWHVDGFSGQYSYLPDANYLWCNKHGTEYTTKGMYIPRGFDPKIHNINYYIQDYLKKHKINIYKCEPFYMYSLDPYVIHRRPQVKKDVKRCFVKVSHIPIEVRDCNNTQNPLIPKLYTRDGVKDFRDKLIRLNILKNKHE